MKCQGIRGGKPCTSLATIGDYCEEHSPGTSLACQNLQLSSALEQVQGGRAIPKADLANAFVQVAAQRLGRAQATDQPDGHVMGILSVGSKLIEAADKSERSADDVFFQHDVRRIGMLVVEVCLSCLSLIEDENLRHRIVDQMKEDLDGIDLDRPEIPSH